MNELNRRRQPRQEIQEELKGPENAQADLQQPGKEEEKKKHGGHLRLQTYEEPVAEAFLTVKKVDPMMKSEQLATELRKSKKKEILSKKRYPPQAMQDQSILYAEESYEFLDEADDGYYFDEGEAQDAFTVDQYLNNSQ